MSIKQLCEENVRGIHKAKSKVLSNYTVFEKQFINNAKKVPIGKYFENLKLESKLLLGQKLVENAKIEKLKYDILSNFQTLCNY